MYFSIQKDALNLNLNKFILIKSRILFVLSCMSHYANEETKYKNTINNMFVVSVIVSFFYMDLMTPISIVLPSFKYHVISLTFFHMMLKPSYHLRSFQCLWMKARQLGFYQYILECCYIHAHAPWPLGTLQWL